VAGCPGTLLIHFTLIDLPLCDDSFPRTAPGMWYSIVGTGEKFVIAVLDADYFSQISLFAGDSCESLTCVSTKNDVLFQDLGFDSLAESGLVEYLETGQMYRILVDGVDRMSGNFTLVAESIGTAGPENDGCLDAEPLDLNATVSGSTLLATRDEDLPYCGPCVTCSLPVFRINGASHLTVSFFD
jgi:hypothetical protein